MLVLCWSSLRISKTRCITTQKPIKWPKRALPAWSSSTRRLMKDLLYLQSSSKYRQVPRSFSRESCLNFGEFSPENKQPLACARSAQCAQQPYFRQNLGKSHVRIAYFRQVYIFVTWELPKFWKFSRENKQVELAYIWNSTVSQKQSFMHFQEETDRLFESRIVGSRDSFLTA